MRKLRWVESGVNRCIMLQYWGAGHYFLILKGHHLVFRIKRFAATLAQIIGNVGKNWWNAENGVKRLPICRKMILAPIGVALFGVYYFTVFCLPDLMLPIGAKGL